MIVSPNLSLDEDSQQHRTALFDRPQSTPVSSPTLSPRLSKNHLDQTSTDENCSHSTGNAKRRRLTTLTTITPLNEIQNQLSSEISLELCPPDEDSDDRYCLRPPPLLVLSQSIQAKHPEQLNESKLNHRFSAKRDLPNAPANYSLVFYQFTPMFGIHSHIDHRS